MSTTFDDRERGYENKYAHDMEVEFKITAHAHRLLGEWVAGKLCLDKEKAEEYADVLVSVGVHPDTKSQVMQKVQKDFADLGQEITIEELEAELQNCISIARREAGLQ